MSIQILKMDHRSPSQVAQRILFALLGVSLLGLGTVSSAQNAIGPMNPNSNQNPAPIAAPASRAAATAIAPPTSNSPPNSAAPPSPVSPPSSIPTAAPVAETPVATTPNGFFFYCTKANGYYPAVATCPEGWVAIPVNGPPPARAYRGPFIEEDSQHAVIDRRNTVSLELFGRAAEYSFDLDRAFTKHFTIGGGISNWNTRNHWTGYSASVTVLPVYANYYFSENPNRGFVSAGVDFIYVNNPGDSDTFTRSGFAGTLGGGYESRTNSGFFFRVGGFGIIGRSFSVEPALNIGYSF